MKNKEELIDLVRLAKLSEELEDIDSLYINMNTMVNNIKLINDVDLSQYDCSETVIVCEPREDEVKPSLPVDMILSNAISRQDNFFAV